MKVVDKPNRTASGLLKKYDKTDLMNERHAIQEIFLRAALKFGLCVHFALRCKMLNPPIARLPAIKLDLKRSCELRHGPN